MARPCPQGREILVGPRGGHYYLSPSGHKVYCAPPAVPPVLPMPPPIEIYLGSVEISSVTTISQSGFIDELTRMYLECFHRRADQLTFLPPSTLFVVATDSKYTNLIASAVVSYARPQQAYIFNVCTRPAYRGKGYMRTLMVALIDQVRTRYPTFTFYLDVEPGNIPAKRLYESLGFIKVRSDRQGRKIYDLMELK